MKEEDFIPPIWKLGYDMDRWLEMPMHLLGHGVITSIIELTEVVFREHSLWSRFTEKVNVHLSDMASFRLSWCSIKCLPKKIGSRRIVLVIAV